MKLTTPFIILNRKFKEIDLNKDVMNKRKLATERLHEDYRKMYKNHQFVYQPLIEFFKELWFNQANTFIGVGLGIIVFLRIYIKLLDIYQQFL